MASQRVVYSVVVSWPSVFIINVYPFSVGILTTNKQTNKQCQVLAASSHPGEANQPVNL